MSGHDNDNTIYNNDSTDNNNGLEFFHPDWDKYMELINKPFDEFTRDEQTFFRRMYLWEEMGWGVSRAECLEDY